jgi:N-formylglutamate amidohydrolase
MFQLDHPQKNPILEYYAPLGEGFRGLLSIPHSGEDIPEEFETYLCGLMEAYGSDVDYKVNELVDIGALQRAGVAVLVARVHRICVDLNRAEDHSVLFWKQNTRGVQLVVKDPLQEDINRLINTYHRPYYEVLKTAITELERKKKGPVSVVDLHSMPSAPTAYHMKQNPNQKLERPDFCLSDRRGKTCTPEFIKFFQDELTSHGHTAWLNDPYVGGFVTEYVDQFRTNNIQIEIKRGIYMDEEQRGLIPEKVARLRPVLTEVLIKAFEKFNT